MVLGFCQGCAAGFAIPVASSFGAGNEKKMRQYVFLGAILTAVIALILTLTTCLLNTEIVHLLQTPAEIAEDAETYLFIIFLGIPCPLLYNYLFAILRTIGDSRTPFYFPDIFLDSEYRARLLLHSQLALGCRRSSDRHNLLPGSQRNPLPSSDQKEVQNPGSFERRKSI